MIFIKIFKKNRMKNSYFVIFLLIASICYAHDSDAENISTPMFYETLNIDSVETHIKKESSNMDLLFFGTTGCNDCDDFKPTFSEIGLQVYICLFFWTKIFYPFFLSSDCNFSIFLFFSDQF